MTRDRSLDTCSDLLITDVAVLIKTLSGACLSLKRRSCNLVWLVRRCIGVRFGAIKLVNDRITTAKNDAASLLDMTCIHSLFQRNYGPRCNVRVIKICTVLTNRATLTDSGEVVKKADFSLHKQTDVRSAVVQKQRNVSDSGSCARLHVNAFAPLFLRIFSQHTRFRYLTYLRNNEQLSCLPCCGSFLLRFRSASGVRAFVHLSLWVILHRV